MSGSSNNQTDETPIRGATVWDLSQPTTPAELGSRVDRFVELDGPADVVVTFPSGRSVSGRFENGALAEADPNTADGAINHITLIAAVSSPDDLKRRIDEFVAEWGPLEGDIDSFVAIYDEVYEPAVDLRAEDFGGVGADRSVRRFDAAEQDGITAGLGVRVSSTMTLRWSLRFDPGS